VAKRQLRNTQEVIAN